MSESENEPAAGINDDALPDDLVPGDDNPLAEGLDDGESVDGMLTEGKTATESDEADGAEATDESDGSHGADDGAP
ncbi:MAG: hypothetical protein WB767_12075 [Nocardioides sp.]